MRKMVRSIMLSVAFAALPLAMPVLADTINIGFQPVLNVSNAPSLTIAGQLSLEVELVAGVDSPYVPDGYDWVAFTFSNTGSVSSVVKEVYWDWEVPPNAPLVLDPTPPSPGGFYFDSSGGSWNLDPGAGNVNPDNLPQGSNIAFVADAGADQGGNDGISNGESATFFLGLVSGSDWQDVSDLIYGGLIRFGMHVGSSTLPGGSDAFVSLTPTPPPPPFDNVVPIPGAAGLGLLGMALVAKFRKKIVK